MIGTRTYSPPVHILRKLRANGWGINDLIKLRSLIAMFPRGRLWQRVYLQLLTGGFTPTDIAGLVLWLDFSDITTLFTDSAGLIPVTSDADPIGRANDKSGEGNDVTQATAGNKPTYKTGIQNSLSASYYDIGDWLLGAGTVELSQPNTIFVVNKHDTSAQNNFFAYDGHSTSTKRNAGLLTNQGGTRERIYAGSLLENALGALPTTTELWTDYFNGASSYRRTNGTQTISGNAGTQPFLLSTIGATNLQNGDRWLGHIMEVLVYNATLSDADRTSGETYLNDRWSIY